MKTALAILGSPREHGNAAQLLDHAVNCAVTAGYKVRTVNLYQQNIAWCKGCMACKKTGICSIKDDLTDIREYLTDSDLVILSSPTYFANVTAPVKNMFDRLVGAVMDDNNSPIPRPKLSSSQKYLLLTTCNTPFPFDRLGRQSSGCIRSMKEFFHISGMKCMGTVVFAGTRGQSQVPLRVKRNIEQYF